MNRQAIVGLFTIVALVALFGIFFVLANYGTHGRYPIGVHFKSASGLQKGSLVSESGVVVGTVDSTQLLPDDFSVEVIMSIDNGVDIPRDATFLIQAPLTGTPTVEIVPPSRPSRPANYVGPTPAPRAVAVLPHQVLPLDQQPQGVNPTTIGDLLAEGQGQIRRLDRMLAQLEKREPRLLDTLQSALTNANDITVTTKRSLGTVADRLESMSSTLQLALNRGSANLTDITSQLDETVRGNRGHIDSIAVSLDSTAHSLRQTADSVRTLASDPRLRGDLLRASKGIADTATTVATIAGDLRNVTGNRQTQAQLRDTISNADAAMQKANSLLGSFGGTSSVYGVDPGATPAPASPQPATGTSTPAPRASGGAVNVKSAVSNAIHNLGVAQMRFTELNAVGSSKSSRLLRDDRGPQSDYNLLLLPYGSNSILVGANDLGSSHTTYNFLPSQRFWGHWNIGAGVLYSNFGMRILNTPPAHQKGVGLDARFYDPRRPTGDLYLNVPVGTGIELFGGERDIFHSGRRTAFGFQYTYP
jgi:ABC-type transporter Mla subunit MlaD